jgi:hypothetical protein
MKAPQEEEQIRAGVYDSSRGASLSNWQWSNVTIDRAWEGVAALIHQGWPADKQAFPNKQAFLEEEAAMLGMIRGRDSLWLYRVYPAGRDSDRPGRYFFAVLRLSSLEQVLHPRIAGILAYFEKERGLPLNTSPLEREWPKKEKDVDLSNLHRAFQAIPRESHRGIDGHGRTLSFKFMPWEAEAQEHHPGHGSQRKIVVGLLFAGAVGVGGFMMKSFGPGIDAKGDAKTTTPEPGTDEKQPEQGDEDADLPEVDPVPEDAELPGSDPVPEVEETELSAPERAADDSLDPTGGSLQNYPEP